MDPFQLVKEEIDSVSERLRRSIFTGIPTLRSAAQYFFKVGLAGSRSTAEHTCNHSSLSKGFLTCHVSCTARRCVAWLHAQHFQGVTQWGVDQRSGAPLQVGAEGKRFRPTMLLLMASSLSSVMPSADYLTVDDRPPNVHPEEVSHSPILHLQALTQRPLG